MSDPVHLSSSGPPETVLPAEAPEIAAALAEALARPATDRRAAVATVVGRHPGSLEGWATLGDVTDDVVDAYAAYRVGYHRGLDRLRQSGWRGSGYVRWEHPTNRGFLRALAGLQRTAGEIGEDDERDRTHAFLRQLDPTWPPSDRRPAAQ